MGLILKKTRELLTIMTGCPEYKYWVPDNDKNIVDEKTLPPWIATIRALEVLVERLKEMEDDAL